MIICDICTIYFFYIFSICRKAISRSGLQHLAPVHSLNIAVSNGPVKEPRAALEWTVGVCFYGNVFELYLWLVFPPTLKQHYTLHRYQN